MVATCAIFLSSSSFAQDGGGDAETQASPVQVRMETYLVKQETDDNGASSEVFEPATEAAPGEVMEYRVFATNTTDTTLPAGIVKITGPIPDGMRFVEGSATPTSDRVLTEFSADGGATYAEAPLYTGTGDDRTVVPPDAYTDVRWTLQVPMEPGVEEAFYYRIQRPISVQIRVETYVVSEVTKDDGTKEERFSDATSAFPGQVVEYRIFATNVSDATLQPGILKVTGPVPDGMTYVEDSATPSSDRVLTEFSADGGVTYSEPPVLVGTGDDRSVAPPDSYTGIRWTLLVPMDVGDEEPFYYRVTVDTDD